MHVLGQDRFELAGELRGLGRPAAVASLASVSAG
jgi:hypothetical protein